MGRNLEEDGFNRAGSHIAGPGSLCSTILLFLNVHTRIRCWCVIKVLWECNLMNQGLEVVSSELFRPESR